MKRLRLLVAFGGESSEHDVSVASARNIVSAIDTKKYTVSLAYIDRAGRWWLHDEWYDSPEQHTDVQLVAAPGTAHFLTVPGSQLVKVDVLFPVLHGKHGEDGSIQGLADVMHVPVVGCGIEASAVCMNKDATKRILEAHGIPVAPWVSVQSQDTEKAVLKEVRRLHAEGPWFVKPSRSGSSVGVSKVDKLDDIWSAVLTARKHDSLVLIETAISGRELEVAVRGNPPGHKASRAGEIIAGSDFYDYDDKYSESSESKTVLRAELPKAIERRIREYALEAYSILGCSGLARVDFLLDNELTPYINEINTMPGFTDISMYPKLWQDKGMDQVELIDSLIMLALD